MYTHGLVMVDGGVGGSVEYIRVLKVYSKGWNLEIRTNRYGLIRLVGTYQLDTAHALTVV